jgi:hypothetical protein
MTSRCTSESQALLIFFLAESSLSHLVLVAGNRSVHISKHCFDGGTGAQGIAETSPLLNFENALGGNGSLLHGSSDACLRDTCVLRLSESALVLNDTCELGILAWHVVA